MKDLPFELNGLDGNHTVQSMNFSERLVKELIKGHEAQTSTIREDASLAVSEMDGIDWTDGNIPVLAIIEYAGEPGDDYIVIYNYERRLRMTGLRTDEHGHREIYGLNTHHTKEK